MLNQDTVKVLNDLSQASEDGKMGFAEASKGATKSKTITQQESKTTFNQPHARRSRSRRRQGHGSIHSH
jgi:hypothetical protein